jgi:hypothetical protein
MSKYQRRRAPAFQEYAADMLANSQFRMMTLEEKGLLTFLRYECWVNDRVPATHVDLARYLGLELEKISSCLTPRVLTFLESEDGHLICPELDAYRASLVERSNKLSIGGSKGGKKTQEKNKANQASLEASLKPLSRAETNKEEMKLDDSRSLDNGSTNQFSDPWIDEYEASPDAPTPYLIASRGS